MSLGVLLVEDDRELRATLRETLSLEGYRVVPVASLVEARAVLAHAKDSTPINLVLLDLGLPDGDGATLLDLIRQRHALPVLVISARQSDGQKIGLLDAGADDYLVKPFALGELLARMRVALRHRGDYLQPAVTRYRHGSLQIDLAAHRVSVHDQILHLTPTEFKLLARLVRSAGQIVTHRQLLIDVWGAEFAEHTHYLRLYMGQLRAKLEENPADPQRLQTELGIGYRLTEAQD
jgi:two-component system KDP operon response regulator KdpE